MKNNIYIDCIRQSATEKEGTLFLRSKGRENKRKKSLKIKVGYIDKPVPDDKYYAGVDVGLGTDASVLSIINQYGDLIKYYKWNETNAQNVIDNIIELNRVWNFKRILFETNNNGLPMYQTLKKTLSNIEDFSTSAKSKPQIINRLIHLFDTGLISCINDHDLKVELEAFNFKMSDSGNVKFGAASGFHDDIIMSLAIARECYERSRFNGRYVGFY